jgi:hypothetical protein
MMTHRFGPHRWMAITTAPLALALVFGGCAARPIDRPDSQLDISRIRIDATSAHAAAGTISRCSGFLLSEKEVRNFLTHAARFRDDGSVKRQQMLPCSASGSAVINGRKYRWEIRAGGVGTLVSGTDRFATVCGKQCCDKVPGLC